MTDRFSYIEIDNDAETIRNAVKSAAAPALAAPRPDVAPISVTIPVAVAPVAVVAPVAPVVDVPRIAAGHIVAVDAATQTTGAVVYWHLSETPVSMAALTTAWVAAGLNVKLLPAPASAEVAFGRAAKELAARNILVRKNPSNGWTVVREQNVDGELVYATAFKLQLREGKIVVVGDEIGDTAEVERAAVQTAYDTQRANIMSIDVSLWMRRLVGEMDGVPLRATGGIYFVPRDYMEMLHKAKAAIESVSPHVVHEIPAMHSAAAVSAVLDALQRETVDWLTETGGELATGIGMRAARTRIDSCEALMKKVAGYEKLLGCPLTGITSTLQNTRRQLLGVTSRGALLETD